MRKQKVKLFKHKVRNKQEQNSIYRRAAVLLVVPRLGLRRAIPRPRLRPAIPGGPQNRAHLARRLLRHRVAVRLRDASNTGPGRRPP